MRFQFLVKQLSQQILTRTENVTKLSSPQDNFQLLIKTEHGTSIHFITKAVTMVENAAQFDSDNL